MQSKKTRRLEGSIFRGFLHVGFRSICHWLVQIEVESEFDVFGLFGRCTFHVIFVAPLRLLQTKRYFEGIFRSVISILCFTWLGLEKNFGKTI